MNKLPFIALISLATLSVSSGAFAQANMQDRMNDKRMGMDKMRGQHHMMHMMMDANQDGSVSQEEFQSFRSKNFSGADKNGDKALTQDEFMALAKQMQEQRKKAKEMAKQKKMQKQFQKLDANGDGKISKEEFDAKGERSFIRMDHNDDGVLNKEDRQKKMRKMKKMNK